MKIVLDAGHGPQTPGKRCPDDSMREYHFNSVVARYAAYLLSEYIGVETLFTFEDGRDIPLKERTDRANACKADIYVSIHANAMGAGWSDACGVETFVHETPSAESVKLANSVHKQMIAATCRKDRGVKRQNFHVLRETNMPAILVECGFMSNKAEAALLKADDYRRKCAQAIVSGIAECYGLKRKPVEPVKLPEVQRRINVEVNGEKVGEGYIIGDITYVPVRHIADVYEWDPKTETIKITE